MDAGYREAAPVKTKTVAFFNNKGGVGKTSLLYHVANMFALQGMQVVAADLDPQANLSGMFLQDDRIDDLWESEGSVTVYSAMEPLLKGTGKLQEVIPETVADGLALLPGDLELSAVEDDLSEQWPHCLDGKERAFRVTAAFDHMIRAAGEKQGADIALIDVGPNLGAINRCALISADYVVIPIGADLFSIRGLRNVGPKLQQWRNEWKQRLKAAPKGLDFELPAGGMEPIGYVVSRYSSFDRRAAKSFQKWLDRVPGVYAKDVLKSDEDPPRDIETDPNRLAQLKDYRSLIAMAQEARKPMFQLKPADGAIGGHQGAVRSCYMDFQAFAEKIRDRICI